MKSDLFMKQLDSLIVRGKVLKGNLKAADKKHKFREKKELKSITEGIFHDIYSQENIEE